MNKGDVLGATKTYPTCRSQKTRWGEKENRNKSHSTKSALVEPKKWNSSNTIQFDSLSMLPLMHFVGVMLSLHCCHFFLRGDIKTYHIVSLNASNIFQLLPFVNIVRASPLHKTHFLFVFQIFSTFLYIFERGLRLFLYHNIVKIPDGKYF